MSINEYYKKIKGFYESEKGKDILVILIIVLLGLGAFYLGRLSKENPSEGLKIEYPGQEAAISSFSNQNSPNYDQKANIGEKEVSQPQGGYFSSKIGKKYYPINCSAGKTIKRENRIYFSSPEEAERAGYALSSSCQ